MAPLILIKAKFLATPQKDLMPVVGTVPTKPPPSRDYGDWIRPRGWPSHPRGRLFQGPLISLKASAPGLTEIPLMTRPLFSVSLRAAALGAAAVLTAAAQQPAPSVAFSPAERTAIVSAITQAPAQGLPAQVPAADDAGLETQLLTYAAWQYGARVRPRSVNDEWGVVPPLPPTAADIEAAHAAGTLPQFVAALTPADRRYRLLAGQRVIYARLSEAGGFVTVPGGPSLRMGDVDPRVETLRQRLRQEGFGSQGEPQEFDMTLSSAVARYQVARGLEPDGVVGPATLGALNTSAADRLAQIDANLERWRWLPRQLPAERIEINIAGAEAVYYKENAPALSMRIVVGDLTHHTPLFYSALQTVVFNPPWNVPSSIAAKEILPKAARDPGYLARNHFSYIGGRLVQAPGPDSALGLVKFDFPSPYGVYLHDTPSKAAFDRRERYLSHGCMRLQKPLELGRMLLARQGVSAETFQARLDAKTTSSIELQSTVPLFVTYRTAEGQGDGSLILRRDAYGWDGQLARALASATPFSVAVVRQDSECSAAVSG